MEHLQWVTDLVCDRRSITKDDIVKKRVKSKDADALHIILYLLYTNFSKAIGKIERRYNNYEISDFFEKKHPSVTAAYHKIDSWREIYRSYRIETDYYNIKIKERYGEKSLFDFIP